MSGGIAPRSGIVDFGDVGGATAGVAGHQGLVPAPSAGDQDKVLKGDGTWGTAATSTSYSDMETPTGLINGVNVTFTLAHSPSPAASTLGFVRQGGAGAFLPVVYGIDFTLAGATVTMTMAPDASSDLRFSYRY